MSVVLIVDDETKIGKLLSADLSDAGHTCDFTDDPREVLPMLSKKAYDVVVSDLRMPHIDGADLLSQIRDKHPGVGVIMMTAYASLETALETMRRGAYDYIIKPFQTDELLLLITRYEESRRLRAENEGLRAHLASSGNEEIVGESAAIKRVKEIIVGLGKSTAAVLIRGESGTGKELIARAIHDSSQRASGPFVALNCAAIPESLLESELFGYEKGAFTGADKRKMGYFQLADGGTIFLDEIGDLPATLQAKLLRVLEAKTVTPLGSEKSVQIDVRLVSATHRPLEEDIQDKRFREDLFYRLNVFPITLPPLRERKDDIDILVRHFLTGWSRDPDDLTPDALAKLAAYDWPGNIRELRNVMERALILRAQGRIGADDILITSLESLGATSDALPSGTLNLEEIERHYIVKALAEANGNKSEAARLLGITRRALYGRLERYGMDTD